MLHQPCFQLSNLEADKGAMGGAVRLSVLQHTRTSTAAPVDDGTRTVYGDGLEEASNRTAVGARRCHAAAPT